MIILLIIFSFSILLAPERELKLNWHSSQKRNYFNEWWSFQSGIEGTYSYHPKDNGGETMRGITLSTYRNCTGKSRQDFLRMKPIEAQRIAFAYFWLPYAKFKDGRLNILLVSSFWGGGGIEMVKAMQILLRIEPDGIIGEQTILAANEAGPDLFHKLLRCRVNYLRGCWNYQTFKSGWQKSIDFLNEL